MGMRQSSRACCLATRRTTDAQGRLSAIYLIKFYSVDLMKRADPFWGFSSRMLPANKSKKLVFCGITVMCNGFLDKHFVFK